MYGLSSDYLILYLYSNEILLRNIPILFVCTHRIIAGFKLVYSRRIEPNSRTTLIDEQSNPSQLVHQEDVMSRHRGGKQRLRYELFRAITLLSLA